MNNYLIDTSVLSSLINENDVNHEQAIKLIDDVSGTDQSFFINIVIYIELKTLFKKLGIYSYVRDFLDDNGIEFLETNYDTLEEYEDYTKNLNNSLKPNDSLILFTAYNKNMELLTFDEKLKRVYDKLLNS